MPWPSEIRSVSIQAGRWVCERIGFIKGGPPMWKLKGGAEKVSYPENFP